MGRRPFSVTGSSAGGGWPSAGSSAATRIIRGDTTRSPLGRTTVETNPRAVLFDKRTILALFLIGLVLVLSSIWLSPPPPPTEPQPEQAEERPEATPPPQRPTPLPTTGGLIGQQALEPVPEAPAVTVESPFYRFRISTQGGVITEATLKPYPSFTESGPVNLVPPEGPGFLRTYVITASDTVDTGRLLFQPEPESTISLGPDRPEATLVLQHSSPKGTYERTYYFQADRYVFETTFRWRTGDQLPPAHLLYLSLGPRLYSQEKDTLADYREMQAAIKAGEKVQFMKPKDVHPTPLQFDPAYWAAIKTKYFLGALVAEEAPFLARVSSPFPGRPSLEVGALLTSLPTRPDFALEVYLGPQDQERMRGVGQDLQDLTQYGWSFMRPIIQPFSILVLKVMIVLHKVIPNYGLVLVLFGVLMRLLLWPLTKKSFRSMREMQKIQPKLQALRERYKEEPEKLKEATFKLYREHGANPLGGCLPNLIPFPVLIALFFVFQNTIELRGAAFVWFWEDLSRPDPYLVLPIFMGATMLIQQKVLPTSQDPKMKPMMYIMPVFLTFIFAKFASGLVLYYTVSNLATFGQQWLMYRQLDRQEAAARAKAEAAGAADGPDQQKGKRAERKKAKRGS